MLVPGDETVLEAGMVIAIEPGVIRNDQRQRGGKQALSIFSREEMARRVQAARAAMGRIDLDAVIATSYPASYYLSGAPIHCFGRPMATVIPRDGDAVMVTSIIEQGHVAAQSWIADVRHYWDYNVIPDYAEPRPPLVSLTELLAGAVGERGLNRGRIGFEDAKLPVAHLSAFRAALPSVEFVPASDMLDRLRLVLSDEELSLTRAADAIADVGQERLIELITPGASARELVDQVRTAMLDAVLERHPEMPFHFHVGTGLGAAEKGAGHSEWATWNRDSRVETGQLLETVISVWLWGYWGNVERAVYVGEPSAEVRQAFQVMVDANEAAIAATRPGIPLADVDRAAKAVLTRHGYQTRTGSGCGRGITSYEADARELKMDLRLYSEVILEPGMAFSLEPDLDVPGLGTFRHCNTIIVTETGCEVDSRLPRGIVWV
jgi:Xaa-Pro aminopeptidase